MDQNENIKECKMSNNQVTILSSPKKIRFMWKKCGGKDLELQVVADELMVAKNIWPIMKHVKSYREHKSLKIWKYFTPNKIVWIL